MSINLKTDCEKCTHKKVCRNVNNAKHMSDKLKALTYGTGPNDDYDWDTMSDVEHVQIDISCTDFEKFAPTLRTPVSDKTVTTAFGKKTEGTGWDNPPRFNSMEERDLYYK